MSIALICASVSGSTTLVSSLGALTPMQRVDVELALLDQPRREPADGQLAGASCGGLRVVEDVVDEPGHLAPVELLRGVRCAAHQARYCSTPVE